MKGIGLYPRVHADTFGTGVVSQSGGVALVETARAAGLDRALSMMLARWRKPLAIHDPGKVICDLAVAVALGGDCLADIALLRAEPAVFGRVASDPTVSRTIDALAADAPRVLKAIDTARAAARSQMWRLAGEHAPDHSIDAETPLIIDTDATLITAHSEKEQAAPTFKRGFGFHPLWSFADHGADGSGEPLSFLLRAGNAGSNTAADHIAVVRAALAQLPGHRLGRRRGRRVLIRADAAGATHEFLKWLTGQRLAYSVGFTLPDSFAAALALIPDHAWTPAYDADGEVRDGAWVTEVTDLLDLELRHRRRARCEDRIRCAKDTGLSNLPLHDFTQNQIWCAIIALACELIAWMQMLTLANHQARRWEPKRLRLRLFSIAARLAHHGRSRRLHLSAHAPWAELLAKMISILQVLPAPG